MIRDQCPIAEPFAPFFKDEMIRKSNDPILRLPTRDDNDADHLAIIAFLLGCYFLYRPIFTPVGGYSLSPPFILVGALLLVSGPLIWLRVPHAKWGGVLAFSCAAIGGAVLLLERGPSVARILLLCSFVYGVISYYQISPQKSTAFSPPESEGSEPDPETVDFVGYYIDQIHGLNWPGTEAEYIAFFNDLPHPQRVLWATWILQCEVDNGGHSQYFFNLDDDSYLVHCLEGLEELGAGEILDILREALDLIEVCKDELSTAQTWQDWIEVLDKHDLRPKLWRLDKKFFRLKAEYYEMRKTYIEKHLSIFEPLGSHNDGQLSE